MSKLIGRTLPYTDLPSTMGGTINPANLRGLAVIFCYPYTGRPDVPNPPNWDTIPGAHGSTPQAQAYATLHGQFATLNAQVFGLSFQESSWQAEFADRCNLPFALLSDVNRTFAIALHLETFRAGDEDYLKRITLVTRDAEVVVALEKTLDPAADASEVLSLLQPH